MDPLAPDASSPAPRPRARAVWRGVLAWGPLALVLWLVVTLTSWDIQEQSPTSDEYAHLVRGIAWWSIGDTQLSNAHPPLANALSGLPVAFDEEMPDFTTTFRSWQETQNANRVATSYGSLDYAGMRAKLMQARRMTVLWLLGALGYLYWRCRDELGLPAALAAVVLLGLNPTVIAQARLVTTDLPVMAAVVVACGEYARHLRGGRGTWVTVPLTVGAAVTIKYSALLLCVLLPLFGLWAAILRTGRYAGQRRRAALGRWALHTVTTALGIVLIINMAYRFNETGLTAPQIHQREQPKNYISDRHPDTLIEDLFPIPLDTLPRALPIPIPYHYLYGVALIRGHHEVGSRAFTFRGKREPRGHWLYFPTMVLTKTPLSILALWLVGAILWWTRRRVDPFVGIYFGVGVLMLGFSMGSSINLGVRHALPYIGLGVVPAAATVALVLRRHGPRPWLTTLLALLLGHTVIQAIAAGPRYLGWWNPLVDPRRGHELASIGDDWFQDRADLARYVNERALDPFYYAPLHPLGTREMRHLDVRFKRYRCRTRLPDRAWVAIHVYAWMSNRHRCYAWSKDLEPVTAINDHILLFWLPPGTEQRVLAQERARRRKRRARRARRAQAKAKATEAVAPPAPEAPADATGSSGSPPQAPADATGSSGSPPQAPSDAPWGG